MSRQFDLNINFPVKGLDNIDSANKKLAALAASVDQVAAKIVTIGKSSSFSMAATLQAVNQAARAAGAASAQAANTASQNIQASAQTSLNAYKQLIAAVQQANRNMRATPSQPGGGGGGGGNSGGGGGQGGSGGMGGMYSPTRMVFNALGLGAGAYVGFEVFKQAAQSIKEMVQASVEGAVQLRNFALTMGITTSQAKDLQNAAKLSGVEIGGLENAIRTVSAALEDPAGAGKRTADALRDLGVVTRDLAGNLKDPGQVAIEMVVALSKLTDAARQDKDGVDGLGRSFKTLVPLIKELKQNSQEADLLRNMFNEQTNDQLVKAHSSLVAISSVLSQMRDNFVAGLEQPLAGMAKYLTQMANMKPGALAKFDDGSGGLHSTGPGRYGDLHFAMPPVAGASAFENNDLDYLQARKRSLQEQLGRDSSAITTDFDINHRTPSKATLDDYSQTKAALDEVEKRIKALQDNGKKAAKVDQRFADLLASYQDRISEREMGLKGPVERDDIEYQAQIRRFKDTNVPISTVQWQDLRNAYWVNRGMDVKAQQDKAESKDILTSEQREQLADRSLLSSTVEQAKELSSLFKENPALSRALGGPSNDVPMSPWLSSQDVGTLRRTYTRGMDRIGSTMSGPGEEGLNAASRLQSDLAEIAAQQQLAAQQIQNSDSEKKNAELEKLRLDTLKEGLEAAISYEQELANIRKEQLNETRQLSVGIVNAAMKGHGAMGKFWEGQATHWFDQVVGNFGAETIGTLNSHLSLQGNNSQPGLLMSKDANGNLAPNAFGRLLAGTPWGIDGAKGGPGGNPLESATKLNSDATKTNSDAVNANSTILNQFIQLMGKQMGIDVPSFSIPTSHGGGGGGSTVLGGGGVANSANLGGAISSTSSALQSAMRPFTSLFGGGTNSGMALANSIVGGIGGTAGTFGRLFGGGGAGGAQPQITSPGIVSPSPATSSTGGSVSIPTSGGGSLNLPLDLLKLPSAAASSQNETGLIKTTAGANTSLGAAGDASTISKLAGSLGNMMGGARYGTNGYGLGAVLTGQAQTGPGQMTNLSTAQQVGAGLAMGAQVSGGVIQSVQGFGKGGVRGDISGVAGAATAIAPFTGPAAPFVDAGATALDMIDKLLPDPQEERRKQESATLTHDAYIAPAARDYDFSSEGSGYSLGAGSTLRSGGPTANYTMSIQALDAQSFVTWANANPNALAQGTLAAIQSGGLSSLDAEIAWRSQNGGAIPGGW